MKEGRDYINDIAEIRSMMERSSKFLSLSGWAGIMAGIYALAGAFIAYRVLDFNPGELEARDIYPNILQLILLAAVILALAVGTAVFFSYKNANSRGEKLWNPTAKRLLINMAVPLAAGGLLCLILIAKGLIGLVPPLTLIFYGLALYNGSKFTYEEVRVLGVTQVALGLLNACFVGYGLLFWALGFGLVHIVYGIYMHYKYER